MYTKEFLEKMFVGLEFEPEIEIEGKQYSNFVYFYCHNGSDFEEEHLEFGAIDENNILLLKKTYSEEDEETKTTETWIDYYFIPISDIKEIYVSDPIPQILKKWNIG